MPRHARRRPARRHRKRVSKRGKALREKIYRYKMTLPSQVAAASTIAPGGFSIVGSQVAPLLATSIGVINASTNGLTNFYDCGLSCTFRFADLKQYLVYQSMYDTYRLDSVTLDVEYLNNVSAVNTNGLMPTIYAYWDQDDAAVPGNISAITGKQGCQIRQFGNKSKTVFRFHGKPNTLTAVQTGYTGGVTAPTMINQKNVWLNCADDSVPHYAFKMWITDLYLPGSATVNQAMRFNWTYNMSFKAPILTT